MFISCCRKCPLLPSNQRDLFKIKYKSTLKSLNTQAKAASFNHFLTARVFQRLTIRCAFLPSDGAKVMLPKEMSIVNSQI